MMNATSGLTCTPQLSLFDLDSPCSRTCVDISHSALTLSSKTLPKSGGMHNGQLYEHPTSARRTTANAYSFLPTPTASDHKRADSPADQRRKSPGITTCSKHWPGLVEPPTSTTR